MKNVAKLVSLLGFLAVTACGGDQDHAHEQGMLTHDHNGSERHAHDRVSGHDHGDDSHSHEVPETEAFYGVEASAGNDAPAAGAAVKAADGEEEEASGDMHSHGGGEPHTHDH
jgi:hypothetical protein